MSNYVNYTMSCNVAMSMIIFYDMTMFFDISHDESLHVHLCTSFQLYQADDTEYTYIANVVLNYTVINGYMNIRRHFSNIYRVRVLGNQPLNEAKRRASTWQILDKSIVEIFYMFQHELSERLKELLFQDFSKIYVDCDTIYITCSSYSLLWRLSDLCLYRPTMYVSVRTTSYHVHRQHSTMRSTTSDHIN